MNAHINADDIACASAAADLFGGNDMSTNNKQIELVAQLFADHREKAEHGIEILKEDCASLRRMCGAPLLYEEMRAALKELVEAEESSEQQFTATEIDRIEAAIGRARELL